jgi:hypothetical protein
MVLLMIQNAIQVETNSERVEEHLEKYRDVIGEDYEGYRGHVYRVLSYSLHYLGRDASRFRPAVEVLSFRKRAPSGMP